MLTLEICAYLLFWVCWDWAGIGCCDDVCWFDLLVTLGLVVAFEFGLVFISCWVGGIGFYCLFCLFDLCVRFEVVCFVALCGCFAFRFG